MSIRKYGGDFKVVHYTQFIADLIKQGKLKLTNELNSILTYHDPCYLGRYNNVYQEPRRIIRNIPKAKFKEMERSKNTSFCCGGGGGHMWIEEQPGTTKINQMRMEEVLKTGAETVVTACPYCLQMFEESIEHKSIKDSLKAIDLIELVEAAMKQSIIRKRSCMNIIVCVKQVLDPEIPPAKFKIDPETKKVIPPARRAACNQCI